MMGLVGLFSSTKAKLIVLAIVAFTAFVLGWKVNGWKHDAETKRQLERIIKTAAAQAKMDRVAIASLQAKKQEVITKEVIRHVKIKDVTDDRVCFANWGAVQLWNAALAGQEPVPENSAGTTNPTGTTVATDTEILENLNTNAARWERLREQMSAIIEWDKKTFDKE